MVEIRTPLHNSTRFDVAHLELSSLLALIFSHALAPVCFCRYRIQPMQGGGSVGMDIQGSGTRRFTSAQLERPTVTQQSVGTYVTRKGGRRRRSGTTLPTTPSIDTPLFDMRDTQARKGGAEAPSSPCLSRGVSSKVALGGLPRPLATCSHRITVMSRSLPRCVT